MIKISVFYDWDSIKDIEMSEIGQYNIIFYIILYYI